MGNACVQCAVTCSTGSYVMTSCSGTTDSVCSICAAGSFSNTTNAANCTLCPLGSYTSSSGLSVCTACKTCSPNGYTVSPCPAGSTSDVSACACNAGYYGTGLTCTACKTCSANGYLSATCPAGSTSDVSACTCNAGYLGNGLTCVCPSGYYSSGSCLPCTNGNSYSTYTGPGTTATNCPVTCNAGFYASGGFLCTPCAAGTYSAGGSATVCTNCTNAWANATYTGAAASDACPYTCPAFYTRKSYVAVSISSGLTIVCLNPLAIIRTVTTPGRV